MTRAEEHLVFSYSSFGKRENGRRNWSRRWASTWAFHSRSRCSKRRWQRFPLRILAVNTPTSAGRSGRAGRSFATQTVTRPAVHDQYDFAASVTSVAFAVWLTPESQWRERYLGWPVNSPRHLRFKEAEDDEPDDELDATGFGLQVHALLAGQPVADATAEARKLADAFHTSELGRRAARASRIEREADFLMAVEDIVLRGQIDLWFEEGGELVLADYKTDEVKARDAAERSDFYAPQLRLYAMALERITGRFPDKAYVYFLRPAVAVSIALERTLLDDPEALVRAFREALRAGRRPVPGEPGPCPYFHGCARRDQLCQCSPCARHRR
jgi:ATP-dependent exoDNAse (exonuclease V) beta subunit